MGTDIHVQLEYRKKGEKQWHWLGEYLPDFINKGHLSPCTDRCYLWFGLLADVRNGYGFAGCDLGDPVEPIAPHRGLPRDMSESLLKSDVWLGDHSFTWVHGDELANFDWDNTFVVQRRYVLQKGYEQHMEKPGSMRSSFGGGGPEKISNEEMERIIKEGETTDKATLVEWKEKVSSALPWDVYWQWRNLNNWINWRERDNYEIRAIIGFDS